MPMSRTHRTTGRDPWRIMMRTVAVLFLLLAAADLAFPQACRENEMALSKVPSSLTLAAAPTGDETSDQSPREDCFCCCSHIVSVESQTLLSSLPDSSNSPANRIPASPVVPVHSLFRPPRLG